MRMCQGTLIINGDGTSANGVILLTLPSARKAGCVPKWRGTLIFNHVLSVVACAKNCKSMWQPQLFRLTLFNSHHAHKRGDVTIHISIVTSPFVHGRKKLWLLRLWICTTNKVDTKSKSWKRAKTTFAIAPIPTIVIATKTKFDNQQKQKLKLARKRLLLSLLFQPQ